MGRKKRVAVSLQCREHGAKGLGWAFAPPIYNFAGNVVLTFTKVFQIFRFVTRSHDTVDRSSSNSTLQ